MKKLFGLRRLVPVWALLFVVGTCLSVEAQRDRGSYTIEEQIEILNLHIKNFDKQLQLINKNSTSTTEEITAAIKRLQDEVGKHKQWMTKLEGSPLAEEAPPIVTAFALKYVPVKSAALTVKTLLGTGRNDFGMEQEPHFKIAVDVSTNQLIVSAKPTTTQIIADLLQKIDRTDASPPQKNQTKEKSAPPTSLLVRIFWLADGLPHPNAQKAYEFLPKPVTAALAKAGIANPYIIVQSNSSIAFHADDMPTFEVSKLPATVLTNQQLSLHARGELIAEQGGLYRLSFITYSERTLNVAGRMEFHNESQVNGSVVAPLGHYLILGTTNYAYHAKEAFEGESEQLTQRGAMVLQLAEGKSFAPEGSNAPRVMPIK